VVADSRYALKASGCKEAADVEISALSSTRVEKIKEMCRKTGTQFCHLYGEGVLKKL